MARGQTIAEAALASARPRLQRILARCPAFRNRIALRIGSHGSLVPRVGSSSSKQRICGYLGAPGIKKTGRPRPAVAFYTWRPGLSIAVQALVAIWTESS